MRFFVIASSQLEFEFPRQKNTPTKSLESSLNPWYFFVLFKLTFILLTSICFFFVIEETSYKVKILAMEHFKLNPDFEDELAAVKDEVSCLKKDANELKKNSHYDKVKITCNLL
uniref:Uncharacterized protein n=1 Tax=Lactuca sativa TaxID=4236 RepID=A0A9R1VVC3_LACSA|nr:hypothetical protein LSAT_V11C400167360 [Lactuca sativa]